SRRRHTRSKRDWSSDVCSSDLLATGRMAPVTGTDLVIGDFAVSPAGDLLALVVNVQKNVSRVYIQPVGTGGGGAGGGAPVAIPTTGAEQMVSATFMP